MIEPNMDYRYGYRALILMMLRRLRIPMVCAVVMIILTGVLYMMRGTLAGWEAHPDGFLKNSATILYEIRKVGWFFTVGLGLFFALTAIPEYRGMAFRLGDNAFYLRHGIMTHREIAIPYHQIQTMTLVENSGERLFGLAGLALVTSGHDLKDTTENENSAVVKPIPRTVAKMLEDAILQKTGKA